MICAANQVLHVVHSKWEAVTSTKVGCTVFYPAVTCPFARKDIQHTYFVSSLTYRSRLFVSSYRNWEGFLRQCWRWLCPRQQLPPTRSSLSLCLMVSLQRCSSPQYSDICKTLTPLVDLDRVSWTTRVSSAYCVSILSANKLAARKAHACLSRTGGTTSSWTTFINMHGWSGLCWT